MAYKLTPKLTLAKDKPENILYYGEKFINFQGPGIALTADKEGELQYMTKSQVIKLCQTDYNKSLEKDDRQL